MGRAFEDYVVGTIWRHAVGRTVTETDNVCQRRSKSDPPSAVEKCPTLTLSHALNGPARRRRPFPEADSCRP
jgi:hypothetical protein